MQGLAHSVAFLKSTHTTPLARLQVLLPEAVGDVWEDVHEYLHTMHLVNRFPLGHKVLVAHEPDILHAMLSSLGLCYVAKSPRVYCRR